MNELAICKIYNYLTNYVKAPEITSYKNLGEAYVYYCWAIDQILERLISEASKLPSHITGREEIQPVDIIEDYHDEMRQHMKMCTNEDTRYVFFIASEAAEDILKLF